MSFFTIGNLLTLGIVAAVLVLYRQLDKNNRSMDKVRKYGEKLKEDLSVFIAEKESSVRDYAIELDVQQKAAKELMNRLVLTDEGLVEKADAVALIDERISAYDKALDELMKMTNRVQENLDRIRDESEFVESSAKKVTEAKGRLIDLERNLSGIESRFERENAEALERTMEASVAAVKSTISDMQAAAETIERQVEDHREAVAKIEQQRAANLARDTDVINKLLRDAVEKAGVKADKLEDAALIKLKEQALERTHRFKDEIEEKLKSLQESAKVRIQEVQGFVKSYKDEWKNENSEIEAKQKFFKEEWKKDALELHSLAKNQQEEWQKTIAETDAEFRTMLGALNTEIADLWKKADDSLVSVHSEIEARQKLYKEEWEKDTQALSALTQNQEEEWKKTAAETDAEFRTMLGVLNTEITSLRKKADDSLASVYSEIEARQKLSKEEWEKDAQSLSVLAQNQKEEWKKTAAETDAEFRTMLGVLNTEITGLRKKADDSLASVYSEIEAKQKFFKEEWEKDAQALSALTQNQKEEWKKASAEAGAEFRAMLESLNAEIADFQKKTDESLASIDKQIKKTAESAEQKALEAAESKLEVYRAAQTEEFHRLENISNDIVQLDAELRRYMNETEKRVREDFALFEKSSADSRNSSAAQFASSIAALQTDMYGLEQELNALKNRAYENVSEKLKIFEDDFFADLSKRSESIDQRFDEWKTAHDSALNDLNENGIAERSRLELQFTENLKSRFTDINGRILAELEHLKAEASAFEEGIREQMVQADHSLESLREQLDRELEDARNAASAAVKSEISRQELSMAEMLKHSQREMESSVKEMDIEFADWKSKFALQIRETNDSLDETKRKARNVANETENHRAEIFSRTEEQVKTLETSIKDADRQIKEFINQTKLFDEADSLKTELERSIEDIKADMSRLDHQKAEIREMEAEFVRIKRLEDEVNAKMTRFMSEKRRIELMEADFNRLLTTSQAVEEKLVLVSSEDDTLQSMQVQLRRLNDALSDTEDKYQRIEKKNQTLEVTNDSIDRNFKLLQETEGKVKRFDESITRMQSDMEGLQHIMGSLTKENEKVRLTQEKLSELDGTLEDVEKRIESMQVAREWLARTESRLAEVSKQAQDYVKLLGDLIKGENKKGMPKDRGAPPIGTRETVTKLAHQGWKVDEIARAVGLSKGEVELILEISPKD